LSTDFITDSRIQTDLGLRRAIIHVRADESAFVRESATESVGDLGQAGVKSAHGVTVRVGMAEKDFEGAFVVNGLHNGFTDSNGLGLA
jgi:hypothetical protein